MTNGVTLGSSAGVISPSRGATSANRLMVDPNDYICGVATDYDGLGSTAGITNAANTFTGTYVLDWMY